ncbi:cupin domain-containing protein [Pseudoclavibacter sp. Z016]|uniref:cupin domain-containing protein n=1 Tax=Pseudoclavibacter sp. Z016 TaxID=2080581 RepID=UPI00215769EF|nr:cupin domain-containing protein [Pseudoclavibacter sp. Z016]
MAEQGNAEQQQGETQATAAEGSAAQGRRDADAREPSPVPARARELGLEPHPEGGWYRRTWTSGDRLQTPNGERPAATLIHFLLPPGESSAWHLVTSDEIWMWHGPGSLELQLGGNGSAPDASEPVTLDLRHAQALVPAGHWQRTLPGEDEVLVSCLVSPGFSFDDFTLVDDHEA